MDGQYVNIGSGLDWVGFEAGRSIPLAGFSFD